MFCQLLVVRFLFVLCVNCGADPCTNRQPECNAKTNIVECCAKGYAESKSNANTYSNSCTILKFVQDFLLFPNCTRRYGIGSNLAVK